MSSKTFNAAFNHASKSTAAAASAQRLMDDFYVSKCKELKKTQKELEDCQQCVAAEIKKYHDKKADWKKLNVIFKHSKMKLAVIHHWQVVVAMTRTLTYKALYRWRSSVVKSIISKHDTIIETYSLHSLPSSPPPPLATSPETYAYDCVPIYPSYSPNTPPESCRETNAEKDVRDLCDIVQVTTIEELKCVLWKVKSLHDNNKTVDEKQRNVVEAKMRLDAEKQSLREAQVEKAKSTERLGGSSIGVQKKRGKPRLGKAERKMKKVQQLLAASSALSAGSRFSLLH